MKQRTLLKRTGIVLTAILSLIAFTTTTLAQCSPRNRRVVVVQQQRYINQGQYYNNRQDYRQDHYYQQGPYYRQNSYYGQPQYRTYNGSRYGYDGYNPDYSRGPSKATNILVGTAIGAVGGALIGGKTGALIGGAAGAGAGYVVYRTKKNHQEQQDRYYPYSRY